MALDPKKQRSRRTGLKRWWLLSVAVHLELLLVMGVLGYFYAPRSQDLAAVLGDGEGETVNLETVDDETARKLLAELEKAEEAARKEQVKKEIEAPEAPGQVVEMARPLDEERPENARFAAEYDSSTKKETKKYGKLDPKAQRGQHDPETRAPEKTQSAQLAQPAQSSPQAAAQPRTALAMNQPGNIQRATQQAQAQATNGQQAAGSEGEPLPRSAEGALPLSGRLQLRPPFGETGQVGATVMPQPEGPPSAAMLMPSRAQVARALGSGTEDHLDDIEEGDETVLNAKKWKYASFFNRVKQQVREHWRPAEAYRRRDPTGSIYGIKDRYTLLRVQLRPDGSLANVFLETPSGVEFLDDEAIEAFKQAQPFPNPPEQLVQSGFITFRFGFFFELSGAPRMKHFHYDKM